DDDFRQSLGDLLEESGYAVARACDGVEALRLLETVRPAVIILDGMMAMMDGETTLGLIRSNPGTEAVPGIFASASAMTTNDLPVVAVVLRKPFAVDALFNQAERYAQPA